MAQQSLQTFAYFQLLPPELRLKVWTIALPDPRIVPLLYGTAAEPKFWCAKSAAAPAHVLVNREAHSVALRKYTRIRGWDAEGAHRMAWLDCQNDILYLPKLAYTMFFIRAIENPEDTIRERPTVPVPPQIVHHLAIHWLAKDTDTWIRMIKDLLAAFTALEHLTFVIDGRYSTEYDDVGENVFIDPEPRNFTEGEFRYFGLAGTNETYYTALRDSIDLVVELVKVQDPRLKMPIVDFKLLVNGPEMPGYELKWDWKFASCLSLAQLETIEEWKWTFIYAKYQESNAANTTSNTLF